jgi:hypothetical protein
MRFKIKVLHWPDAGHYAIAITQGLLDVQGLFQIFYAVSRATEALPDCKVLIDFQDAEYEIGPTEIYSLINRLGPQTCLRERKIALVSGSGKEPFAGLIMLGSCLSRRGFQVAVFPDPKAATVWLT